MRKIAFDELDLSFVPPDVLADAHWRRCIELALRSGSENQRYGALVLLDGKVVGEGFNRLLKKGEPFPFRTTFFLHAERAAIGDAMTRLGTTSLAGAKVLVAGFLVDGKRPLIRRASNENRGSCVQCGGLYVRFQTSISLMSERGWVELPGAAALANARAATAERKRLQLSTAEFRRRICL